MIKKINSCTLAQKTHPESSNNQDIKLKVQITKNKKQFHLNDVIQKYHIKNGGIRLLKVQSIMNGSAKSQGLTGITGSKILLHGGGRGTELY